MDFELGQMVVNSAGGFVGRIVVPQSGTRYAFYNVRGGSATVYAVEDPATGEIRLVRADFLALADDQED